MHHKITKNWIIYDTVALDDVRTLTRLKISCTASTSVVSPMKARKIELSFVTTNEEQEVWLKLYFGDRMIHQSTEHDFLSE